MSEYRETPPEGLWEGIEGALAPKTGALGGFWAWLTGRPGMWPVWATAGVAAAVAAVLLLHAPAGQTPTVNPDAIAEVADSTSTDSSVIPSAAEESPATAPAIHRIVSGQTKHPAAIAQAEEAEPEADTPSEATPETVIPSEVEESQPKQDKADQKQEEPLPIWTPDPFGSTRVPLRKSIKRSKPLLAAALTGGGAPGGGTTTTSSGYGFPTGTFPDATNPKMAMLGRNKSVDTEVSHRQDYQFGLLLNYSFNEHWGIESGVTFTGLTSESSSTNGNITRIEKNTFNYIGVPLRVVYTPFNFKSVSLYLSAGPAAEYGLYARKEYRDIVGEKEKAYEPETSRPGDWIFSASLNAGVQWQPWKYGSFFIQPGVVGRLIDEDSEKSPESYYTTHPVSFQLAAGYKINF